MKKPYNETWINNLHIQSVSRLWLKKNLISAKQLDQIVSSFPESFYQPGIFVKTGLFLFTLLAGSFFAGFISLFFVENGSVNIFTFISFLCAVCYFFALEFLIKDRKLFHSGIDNALLYMAAAALLISGFQLFPNLEIWQYCLIVFLVNSFLVFRYADILVTFIGIASLYGMFAVLINDSSQLKPFLPFCLMLISAVIYFINRSSYGIYYVNCQLIIKISALVVFYLGGNYYIVREGNALLSGLHLAVAPQIPFAGLFYLLTTAIPIIYCFFGLKRKDRILFAVGLLAIAFSCFTYRYYFQLLPLEIAILILGAFLILLTTFLMHYLKTPKFGISDEKDESQNSTNLEALILAHQFGQTPSENNFDFGGGDFGGGGAGSSY